MADRNKPKLLLLEDEKNVGSTLVEWLSKEGFDMTWSTTLEDARLQVRSRKFDLAILDVGLPDGSGFDLAREIREKDSSMGLLFLTAFGGPADRIKGLELGAEDYVAKPFHLKELLLRIQNALKRSRYMTGSVDMQQETLTIGKAKVKFSSYEAESDGKLHSLTPKECMLLKFLVSRSGKAVSRDEILTEVWSAHEEAPNSRTIDNFVMRLRRLIENDPENPTIIKNVRGVGYLLQMNGEKTE